MFRSFFERECSERFIWQPLGFFYALLYVFSHISNGLWQLVEPFRGKLIRDKFKICRQHKIGVTAISSPSDRLASQ